MANFNGQPNLIAANRSDFWMMTLFAVTLFFTPIAPVLSGLLLLPAFGVLAWALYKTHGFSSLRTLILSGMGLLVVVVIVWFSFTSIFSIHAEKSYQVVLRTALLLLCASAIYSYVFDKTSLAQWFLLIYTFLFGTWFTFAFWGIYLDKETFLGIFRHFYETGHPRNYFKNDAALTIFILPIAALFAIRKAGKIRVFSILTIIFCLSLVFGDGRSYAQSRSALAGNLAAVAAVVLFWTLTWLKLRYQALIVTIFVLTIIVGKVIILEKLPQLGDLHAAPPESTLPIPDPHRQIIWSFVYDRLQENPWLGVGVDGISKIEGANIKIDRFGGQEYVPSHPHNWMLEIASETGVMGLFLVLAALAGFVLKLLSLWRNDQADKTVLLATLYAFAGFWSSSLTNFSIWSAWWLANFFIIIAVLLAYAKELKQNESAN